MSTTQNIQKKSEAHYADPGTPDVSRDYSAQAATWAGCSDNPAFLKEGFEKTWIALAEKWTSLVTEARSAPEASRLTESQILEKWTKAVGSYVQNSLDDPLHVSAGQDGEAPTELLKTDPWKEILTCRVAGSLSAAHAIVAHMRSMVSTACEIDSTGLGKTAALLYCKSMAISTEAMPFAGNKLACNIEFKKKCSEQFDAYVNTRGCEASGIVLKEKSKLVEEICGR